MARYYHGDPPESGRLGLLPAAFNPPTKAHIELATQAAAQFGLGQVVLVVPESMPHKASLDATLDDRLAMLDAVAETDSRLAVAVATGGLVVEIVREFRVFVPRRIPIAVLCGTDAAERFANWDYGRGPGFLEQLDEFELIVATRGQPFVPPAECAHRIRCLQLPAEFAEVSATQVREAIRAGKPWRQWLPDPVAEYIEQHQIYAGER